MLQYYCTFGINNNNKKMPLAENWTTELSFQKGLPYLLCWPEMAPATRLCIEINFWEIYLQNIFDNFFLTLQKEKKKLNKKLTKHVKKNSGKKVLLTQCPQNIFWVENREHKLIFFLQILTSLSKVGWKYNCLCWW